MGWQRMLNESYGKKAKNRAPKIEAKMEPMALENDVNNIFNLKKFRVHIEFPFSLKSTIPF